MDVLEEMRAEMPAIAVAYPQGATVTEIASYIGVPLRQIEPALNALETEGSVIVSGDRVRFIADTEPVTTINGQKGGVSKAHQSLAIEGRQRNAYDSRYRIGAEGQFINASPTLDDATQRIRDALPQLVELYPFGISAGELSGVLNIPVERCYKVMYGAHTDGWAEVVKAHGNRTTGQLCVFRGMTVPPPQLTPLQAKVLNWIKDRVDKENICVVNMHQCAQDIGVTMVNDKLDSMERKGFVARLTKYNRERKGQHMPSPRYQVLPTPSGRAPTLSGQALPRHETHVIKTCEQYESYEQMAAEPVAVRRARVRKREIETELEEIKKFLATYERLSK